MLLAQDAADQEVAARAERALRALDSVLLVPFVAHQADERELEWLVERLRRPAVTEAAIARRSTSAALLERLAADLPPALQERLLLRQDRIVELPAILDRLASNPHLSPFARRRIDEYREHLVPPDRAQEPEAAPPEEDEASEAEVATAIAVARAGPFFLGEVEETTGLTEGQVRALPPRVRIRLARKATAAMRQMLLRDSNPRVALAVLKGPALSDAEIEQIARNRAVHEDVLVAISKRREWSRKYAIVLSLCGNPKMPVSSALRLLPQLAVRDLRNLSRDRNVSDAVRAQATRLYMIKSQ